jgi:fatty acid desaturase/cytochrome b involved in lipid metabolism
MKKSQPKTPSSSPLAFYSSALQTPDTPEKPQRSKLVQATTTKTATESLLSRHNTTSRKSLYVLTSVWLSLCAGLVLKHQQLLAVFFAFCASFAWAAILSTRTRWTTNHRAHERHFSVAKTVDSSTLTDSNASATFHTQTKHWVGLAVCLAALLCCYSGSATIDRDNASNTLGETATRTTTTTTTLGCSPEYLALSLVAGYLAFDHWFSALYCQPPPPSKLAIVEDACTLTFVLIVLVLWGPNLHRQQQGTNVYAQPSYQALILAWLGYKSFRLAFSMRVTSTMARMATTTPSQSKTLDPLLLWMIHGNYYDLHTYVSRHPGGKEAILLGRGRDCTALFESYHPFTSQHRRVLEKHRVTIDTSFCSKQQDRKVSKQTVSSSEQASDVFYNMLCQRVAHALQSQGVDPIRDRGATWTRSIYYVFLFAALLASGYAHCTGSLLGSLLFGVAGWFIGALGHDGGHFAVSRRAWLNDFSVWGISWLCNPIMWQHQHTYAHHSFTNEFDHDPDLHHFTTFLRVHRKFQQNCIYRNQANWMYVFWAYTFVTFGACFWIPWGVLREQTLYGLVDWTDRKRPSRTAAFVFHLVTYFGLVMVLPFWTHGTWYKACLGVILHMTTSGLIFAFFSQINHINELSLDEKVVKLHRSTLDPTVRDSWAVAQVEASNNFCTDSAFWHLFSNGLNLQIEHHLFPGINHCHLHHIAPVVRETCNEYGVRYKSYDSWSDIMRAMLKWLDQLSVGLD